MSTSTFSGKTFTAPPDRVAVLAKLFLQHVGSDSTGRVLDFGCGTGEQILALADLLPNTHFVGVDISTENIVAARVNCSVFAQRVKFVAGDYLDYVDEPFDAILSDSVLQNIPVTDEQLYRKLAKDLKPSGMLAINIPYNCIFNTMLWAARRLLRTVRGPAFEAMALALARRIHPDWNVALLRERLPYLYLLPVRFDRDEMREALAKHGLTLSATLDMPHKSLAQPRHRFLVYRNVAR